jgi:hypothetical protein
MVLDKGPYVSIVSDVCNRCQHFTGTWGVRKCDAFKDIPLPIWEGDNDHTKPYPGDHGIQFEPVASLVK